MNEFTVNICSFEKVKDQHVSVSLCVCFSGGGIGGFT